MTTTNDKDKTKMMKILEVFFVPFENVLNVTSTQKKIERKRKERRLN
jgi:hypothetical protein